MTLLLSAAIVVGCNKTKVPQKVDQAAVSSEDSNSPPIVKPDPSSDDAAPVASAPSPSPSFPASLSDLLEAAPGSGFGVMAMRFSGHTSTEKLQANLQLVDVETEHPGVSFPGVLPKSEWPKRAGVVWTASALGRPADFSLVTTREVLKSTDFSGSHRPWILYIVASEQPFAKSELLTLLRGLDSQLISEGTLGVCKPATEFCENSTYDYNYKGRPGRLALESRGEEVRGIATLPPRLLP